MEPRLSIVTLGVGDVARARRFYEALGFQASSASNENIAFFDAGGVAFALFARCALAKDATVEDSSPGFSGITLAHNVSSEAEADAVLAEAVAAGGKLVKPGQKAFWGGYSGYFTDPDGHLWEVAHNPFFPLDAKGRVKLPKAAKKKVSGVGRQAKSPEAIVKDLLRTPRVFAVVGASANADRPSFTVMRYLLSKGHTVIPINPGLEGQEIHGQKVYARLADVPGPVDIVDIFRASDAALGVTREAVGLKDKLKLKAIWMQLGVINEAAAKEASAAGLQVVMDRCPKIEIARLGL